MNVRLERTWFFSAGMVYDGQYLINDYTVTVSMLTVTDDHFQQNIAYERMKYWLSSVLESAVLMKQGDELIDAYQRTGQRVMILPDAPVDQILGIMLYLKLNAICENRLVITDVKISSTAGDRMVYLHSHGESLGNLDQDDWWTDCRPTWIGHRSRRRSGKIINIDREKDWADLGLSWEDTDDETKNTVVFADFVKNENK